MYIDKLRDTETRRLITRLRLDVNKLESCQGRYRNMDGDNKNCPFCPNEEKTVEHFLPKCKHYKEERQSFENCMIKVNPLYPYLDDDRKTRILLNVEPQGGNDTSEKIIMYINKTYLKRCGQNSQQTIA